MAAVASKPEPERSGAEIAVLLPEVKLKLEDVCCMRSIAEGIRLQLKPLIKERLLTLDLIRLAAVPRDVQEIKAAETRYQRAKTDLAEATESENWEEARDSCYDLINCQKAIEPIKTYVLTEKGKALLTHGAVKVRASKVGRL